GASSREERVVDRVRHRLHRAIPTPAGVVQIDHNGDAHRREVAIWLVFRRWTEQRIGHYLNTGLVDQAGYRAPDHSRDLVAVTWIHRPLLCAQQARHYCSRLPRMPSQPTPFSDQNHPLIAAQLLADRALTEIASGEREVGVRRTEQRRLKLTVEQL